MATDVDTKVRGFDRHGLPDFTAAGLIGDFKGHDSEVQIQPGSTNLPSVGWRLLRIFQRVADAILNDRQRIQYNETMRKLHLAQIRLLQVETDAKENQTILDRLDQESLIEARDTLTLQRKVKILEALRKMGIAGATDLNLQDFIILCRRERGRKDRG